MRSALPSANTNRFLRNHTKLTAITEEPLEEEEKEQGAYIHRHDLAREFDALEREEDLAYRKHAIRRDADDSMDWDDESTLVAMLQARYAQMFTSPDCWLYAHSTDSSGVDEQEEVAALANKLKAPMAAQGVAMKEYLGETLLPVISRVKDVHAALEAKGKDIAASCDAHTLKM